MLSDLAQPVVTRKKSDLKRESALEDNKFKGLLISNDFSNERSI
jgi:hypothetical protein